MGSTAPRHRTSSAGGARCPALPHFKTDSLDILETTTATTKMDEDEKDYVESEDEDFNPEVATNADENVSSSEDDEDDQAPQKKPKKQTAKRKADADDELDSGDEATIQEARRKKRRKDKDKAKGSDEESGGEGGLVKTRAQRAAEKEERKEYQRTHKGPVTVDVDALWAKLNSTGVGRRQEEVAKVVVIDHLDTKAEENEPQISTDAVPAAENDDEYITIKRTYEFAGQTVSEEKRVHRDSAEAKLYHSKGDAIAPDTPSAKIGEDGEPLRRPLKRASMFEPNPTGEVKGVPQHKQRLRTPSRADVLAQQKRMEEEIKANGGKAQRLNTVQKSAIDWASHVDSEGLKDELAEYDKSKQGYMSKMDFLQGVQGKRDEDERRARLQKA